MKVWPNILCAGFHKPWKFNLWSKTDAGFKVSARVYRILSSGGGGEAVVHYIRMVKKNLNFEKKGSVNLVKLFGRVKANKCK